MRTSAEEAYSRIKIKPYSYQTEAWQLILQQGPHCNLAIAAGTGTGKTESALLPAVEIGKRIIVLYPTKALLQDQLNRILSLAPGKRIAVDTGDEDDLSYYHADIVLTNLDKFLYRMFGYGKKRYSYLFPYRIAGMDDQRKPLLILDEAHAYDGTIFSHFWFVLKKLTYERRVQTVLLSATLAPSLIEALRDRHHKYFPRPSGEGDFFHVVEDKQIRTGHVSFGGFISSANRAVERAWQVYQQGKRVIMVVRRVVRPEDDGDQTGNTLQEVWRLLSETALQRGKQDDLARKQRNGIEGCILSYHGHQMPSYRRLVLDRLKALDDAQEPYLLLTTSAMEVGVDVSCDLMITDLCEPDSFVQRIGRCARRKNEEGNVYIINADPAPRRTAWVRDYMLGLPEDTELDATRKAELNALNEPPQPQSVDLRLEYQQDVALYRYIYDFVQENRAIWQQGIVITRDWEPTISVVRGDEQEGEKRIGGIPEHAFWRGKALKEKVLLPVSCASDIAAYCTWVFDTFNDEFHQPQRVPVGGKQGRTLKEALTEAGYSAGSIQSEAASSSDGNKSKPQYAVGFPLILLLGSEVPERVFKDDNLGLSYQRHFVSPIGRRPPPLLRTRQVELRKNKGQMILPLYWFEPADGS